MNRRWLREDTLNISMAAGNAARGIAEGVGMIHTENPTPADIFAVLILSAQIDGWNWRRALVDGQDIAADVATRLQGN